jgi:hypothetical protein
VGRRTATWAAVIAVALLAIAAAGVLLVRSAFNEPEIEPQVFAAIESDPGFMATPPSTQGIRSGRRLACRDESGDPPQTFREFSVALPDEQVIGFYRQQLTAHGWASNDSGGMTYSKSVQGNVVELRVYPSSEDNAVAIAARTTC